MRSTAFHSDEERIDRTSFAEQYAAPEPRGPMRDPAQVLQKTIASLTHSSGDGVTTDDITLSSVSPHTADTHDGEVRVLVRDETSESESPFRREGDSVGSDYIFS